MFAVGSVVSETRIFCIGPVILTRDAVDCGLLPEGHGRGGGRVGVDGHPGRPCADGRHD